MGHSHLDPISEAIRPYIGVKEGDEVLTIKTILCNRVSLGGHQWTIWGDDAYLAYLMKRSRKESRHASPVVANAKVC